MWRRYGLFHNKWLHLSLFGGGVIGAMGMCTRKEKYSTNFDENARKILIAKKVFVIFGISRTK